LLKDACFRAAIAKFPVPANSPMREKAYSAEGSEGMNAFILLGCKSEAEMSFLPLADAEASCRMGLLGRQCWE